MDTTIANKGVTRRDFALGTAATACLAACGAQGARTASADEVQNLPVWDKEADIVIIGAGGAGYMAAVAAHECGCSTIMLEKRAATGGDTAISGQRIIGCWPRMTKESSGLDDSVELYLDDQRKSHPFSMKGRTGAEAECGDFTMMERQFSLLPETMEWLTDVAGIKWWFYYSQHNCAYPQPTWNSVYPRDFTAEKDTQITISCDEILAGYEDSEILTSTPAYDLVMNGEGRCVDVLAMSKEAGKLAIKAKRGVIIASGSFSQNPYMVEQHLGYRVAQLGLGFGLPANAGDGHLMAQRAGAKLVDMDLGSNYACTIPGMQHYGTAPLFDSYIPGIFVNVDGVRYVNENSGHSYNGYTTMQQPRSFGWYACDSVAEEDVNTMFNQPIVHKADTIEELAELMGIDAAALKETVDAYNAGVESGSDAFGRTNALLPVARAPFYAARMGLAFVNAQSGPARNEHYQVIDWNDQPIGRLYAGGEFGSIWGRLYHGALNVPEAMNGYSIAGELAGLEVW